MAKDLYFIPLIVQALRGTEPKKALMAAFERIESLGREPEYQYGYEQFQRFMLESGAASLALEDLVGFFARSLPAEPLDDSNSEWDEILRLIEARPEWREWLRDLDEPEITEGEAGIEPSILIDFNGRPWRTVGLSRPFAPFTIKGLEPGHYAILLDTGRLLWEGSLAETDLLWAKAFPEQPVALAADTGDVEPLSTQMISLLDGEWTVLVFPGLESGRLRFVPAKVVQ